MLGGGFVIPGSSAHFSFLEEVQKSAGDGTAAVALAYDLVPDRQYPEQLKQAVGLLTYLTEDLRKKPGNVCHAEEHT